MTTYPRGKCGHREKSVCCKSVAAPAREAGPKRPTHHKCLMGPTLLNVPERTRTSNLWLRRPTLYPLSYGDRKQRKSNKNKYFYHPSALLSSRFDAYFGLGRSSGVTRRARRTKRPPAGTRIHLHQDTHPQRTAGRQGVPGSVIVVASVRYNLLWSMDLHFGRRQGPLDVPAGRKTHILPLFLTQDRLVSCMVRVIRRRVGCRERMPGRATNGPSRCTVSRAEGHHD